MIFFTDRDLSAVTFVDILRAAGLTVERHDDYFDENTTDEVWLSTVGQRRWIALSRDQRIYRRNNERDAMFRAGTCLFVLVGKATFPALADNFVACLPKIERLLKKHAPPFIARVYLPTPEQRLRGSRKSGEVKLWLSYEQWLTKLANR